jgi:hypothetical protein
LEAFQARPENAALSLGRTDLTSRSISQPFSHRQAVHLLCPSTGIVPAVLRIDDFFKPKGICFPERAAQPIILGLQLVIPLLFFAKLGSFFHFMSVINLHTAIYKGKNTDWPDASQLGDMGPENRP